MVLGVCYVCMTSIAHVMNSLMVVMVVVIWNVLGSVMSSVLSVILMTGMVWWT